jgi:hypothetical protein
LHGQECQEAPVVDTAPTWPYPIGVKGKKTPPAVHDAAALLASLGAAKGGRSRAAKLTSDERRQIARKAVLTRWKRSRRAERPAELLFDPIELPGVSLSEAVIRERRGS